MDSIEKLYQAYLARIASYGEGYTPLDFDDWREAQDPAVIELGEPDGYLNA
ncbi:BcepGomrgp29 [Burkholderia phage BcepGomr]|uniref:BcepGomrgp29 n=1 Tax=Burkholderia phage BcepGomr TaxID=437329 RepID=UPI00015034CA|nr:BcepGomrgp29 [Burkholderia phage BcepGomr]ABP63600.1 BcepGomrgp29 [Burkholderia phage BcepGomr]